MKTALVLLAAALLPAASPQAFTGQDVDSILEKADKILDEAKAAYETARSKNSVAAFVDAGFKLEEARIKYIVIQEIGSAEKQKVASDRLRAVNQLSKLIHDGKVAISGTPADAPPEKPADPAAPAPPADPAKLPPPASPAAGLTVRAPIPDAAKQKEAEKTVKDLFKEQYAKKSAADRLALARALMEQAAKSTDDAAAQWVLYREAQDVAIQALDLRLAAAAIESAARLFDVDEMAMKSAAYAAASKTAKTPEDSAALVEALDRLIDEFVSADQYDAADKAAASALQHAKRATDPKVAARATTRAKEVAEAKSKFQSMKGVLNTLAKSPEDPGANLEMGQFLCYVKANWDLGLRFITKGSDATLKALALKEQALPLQPADQVAAADGWWDLSEKEKSPLRKGQMIAHARALYESALPNLNGLTKARVEKRLTDVGRATAPGLPVDLLPLLDPKQDTVLGEWALKGRALVCTEKVKWAHLQIPYLPPDEYDLTIVAERSDGVDAVIVGLAKGSSQFYVSLDGWGGTGSGLGMIDGKFPIDNETFKQGGVFRNGKAATLIFAVRKEGVVATVDGKKIVDWKGEFNRLSNAGELRVPNPKSLYIAAYDSKWVLTKMTLTPVSGEGKRLR